MPDCHVILYNKWFSIPAYREEIMRIFDIKPAEAALNTVAHFGDGSSFDHFKYDDAAQKMRVLTRYKAYLNDKKYRKFFEDRKNLRNMAKLVFGFDPLEEKR